MISSTSCSLSSGKKFTPLCHFRDVLINEVPLIFRKEIYAIACIIGGIVYQFCIWCNLSIEITVIASFLSVVIVRVLAVKYHISLPHLKVEE